MPAGCPPPVLTPPKEENPCEMGYNVGQVIARTLSNIIVPKFLDDKEDNPVKDSVEYQKVKEL